MDETKSATLKFTAIVASAKRIFGKINFKIILKIFTCVCAFVLSIIIAVLAISLSIKARTSPMIMSENETTQVQGIDYIIILGAGLRSDGTPSDMLADRLTVGISLLKLHPEAKLLLTGDNSGIYYNEVASMKKYALSHGVEEYKIVEDGCGYSTYESIFRSSEQFNAKKVIVVTQEYHLYRALYVAEQWGIDAIGVSSNLRSYSKQGYRDVREHAARVKDFFYCLFEYVPISDDGE